MWGKQQGSLAKGVRAVPRQVKLYLRDHLVVEGMLYLSEGQNLTAYLASRRGWVNLTRVFLPDTGERSAHMALQTHRILWAASLKGDIPLSLVPLSAATRAVAVVLEGGTMLNASLYMSERQRLSDYLTSSGDFIPLPGARMSDTGMQLGDIALNQAAIQRLQEAALHDAGEAAPAALVENGAPRRWHSAPHVGTRGRAGGAAPLVPGGGMGLHMDGLTTQHWLVSVVLRAGLPGSKSIAADYKMPNAEVWDMVNRACSVAPDDLARYVAAHFFLPVADLAAAHAQDRRLVPERIARQFGVLPLRTDGDVLVLAVSNPTDTEMAQTLRTVAGREVRFEVAPPGEIADMLDLAYAGETAVDAPFNPVEDMVTGAAACRQEETGSEPAARGAAAPAALVHLAEMILHDAVRARASDMVIDPDPERGTVRFRVDGVLRPHMHLPPEQLAQVILRFKELAALDLEEHTRMQEGYCALELQGQTLNLRVSAGHTRDGERVSVRIAPEGELATLEALGLSDGALQQLRHLLTLRGALVLFAGSPDSGVTSTLYAAAAALAAAGRAVASVEDPVEAILPGITQVATEPRRGVTFAAVLETLLTKNPDVVLVSRVFDADTARLAARAALSGRLVLAVVHAADSSRVVQPLVELGVNRATLSAVLRGAVAQRLLRRVCPHCAARVYMMNEEERRLVDAYNVTPKVRAVGCTHCANTGYLGRLPVAEVVTTTPAMEQMLADGASPAALRETAIAAGTRPMIYRAVERVRSGETTLAEVDRVFGELLPHRATAPAPAQVLLFSEDDRVRAETAATLRQHGCEVLEAASPSAALEQLDSRDAVALVLLDLAPHEAVARALLQRIKSSVVTHRIPVLALLATPDSALAGELIGAGADDFVPRPWTPELLAGRTLAALRRQAR